MIGTRLGQYELIEEVGKGGMATVYRAYQPNVDRYVAVKIIHRSIASDALSLERFQREAKLVTRLEHPHLLPIYDYDGAHDPPYIVMRYLESGTLKDVLDKGQLPHEEMIYMLRQIAAALDYAHRRNIIHRDIKPSNIMIDQDGNAFLTDFGIARMTEAGQGLTQTGYAVGTPGYMSPEQGMGLDTVDGRADLYSLAVMVYQILTREMPYQAETPLATILKHMQDPVPRASSINEELPAELDDVLIKALAKQPDDRYESIGDFVDALTAALKTPIINSPRYLRRAAQDAIEAANVNREKKRDQIDRAVAELEASRTATPKPVPSTAGIQSATMRGAQPDLPTLRTPTDQRTVFPPTAPNAVTAPLPTRKLPVPLIVGAVVAGIAIIALLFGIITNKPSDTTPTPTLQREVAVVPTESTEAATQEAFEAEITQITPTVSSSTQVVTPDLGSQQTQVLPATMDLPSTPENTNTPTSTATDEPSSTPTPATPVAQALRGVIVRLGPASSYPVLANIPSQTELVITGISEDGNWLQVLLPDGQTGWVADVTASISTFGDLQSVSVALAPTDTPTYTVTPSPADTATSTPTSTNTPSSTPTNTSTPTATASDTPTATATPSSTDTPTATPTNTSTPTDTPTNTPTDIPTETATATSEASATPQPSPTPLPAGQLPYVADFEGDTPITGWDYDPNVWQVVTEGGENILIGQGRLNQPLVVLGLEQPEWLNATTQDLVLSFNIRLDPQTGGARVVFRCANSNGCPGGYNVLEVYPGLLSLKRNAPAPDIFTRETERGLKSINAPIEANKWYSIVVWVQGSRIFVYLDRQFMFSVEDLIPPQLGAGAVILQTNSSSRPIRFDNLIIQRPEPASDHFQGSGLPPAWQTTSTTNSTIEQENGGNQYLLLKGAVSVTPSTLPIRDINLTCRVYSEQGGYKMFLREGAGGAFIFEFVGGDLNLTQVDSAGGVVNSYRIRNFYNRNRWENLNISFVGDRLEIYRDGVSKFEETVSGSPAAGGIHWETTAADIVRLDDCLITETASARNAGARFSIDLRQQVSARPFRELRSDLTEDFADPFRTDVWWEGGTSAPGQFVTDTSVADHQRYLRMIHQNQSTFRLFRNTPGVEMFGAGQDFRNYNDSTDLLVSVEVRFPEGPGVAWLGIRTTPTITGAELNGYRVEFHRNDDGTTTVVIRYQDATHQETYYDGPVPGSENGTLPEWITVEAITYKEKVAFFVNGQYVVSLDNALAFGGTLALGVNDGTTADFDTLTIRDTTPHDG